MKKEPFKLYKCSCCGKAFIKETYSIYKLKKNNKVCHYCSYTCYNKSK